MYRWHTGPRPQLCRLPSRHQSTPLQAHNQASERVMGVQRLSLHYQAGMPERKLAGVHAEA